MTILSVTDLLKGLPMLYWLDITQQENLQEDKLQHKLSFKEV
jgi:hypothetical protein